jgi:hypothetical protein
MVVGCWVRMGNGSNFPALFRCPIAVDFLLSVDENTMGQGSVG